MQKNSQEQAKPPQKSAEQRYLDLWEENLRLLATKGLPAKENDV